MQFTLLLTLASSVFAKVCILDIVGKNSCNSRSDLSGSCNLMCPGVLPSPKQVEFVNILSNGHLTKLFRCSAKKAQSKAVAFQDAITICTKSSSCTTISRECFHKAVYKTMKSINTSSNNEIPEKAREVINHIYNAAIETDATLDQLINFTSIAMHNNFSFFKFACPDAKNTKIGQLSRGLLQFTSMDSYIKLNSVSTTNYIARPYLLDSFSECSILDEFKSYIVYYTQCLRSSKVSVFINSIRLLNPTESTFVTEEAAIAIAQNRYQPKNVFEKRVLQRFEIFYVLCQNVFVTEDCVATTKVIRN